MTNAFSLLRGRRKVLSRAARCLPAIVVMAWAGRAPGDSGPSSADNVPISFQEIVRWPSTGITYRRTPPPLFQQVEALRKQSLDTPLSLTEIIDAPAPIHGFGGLVIFDYDGDGDLDLFVSNGPGTVKSLYQNQFAQTHHLTFVDRAAPAGVGDVDQDASGACAADIDNDGDVDLLVLGRSVENRLFINNGNGTFTWAQKSGLEGTQRSASSCTFGDVDGDGLVDVFVGNTFDFGSARALFSEPFALNQQNQLFKNTGGGTFVDISASSGIEHVGGIPDGAAGITWAVAMADVDSDGDVDILATADQGNVPTAARGGVNRGYLHVFQNDGSGHFADHPVLNTPNAVGAWMGLSFGDFNCDGHLDMFGSNAGDYDAPVEGAVPYTLGTLSSRPFLGRGDGTFDDVVGVSLAGASVWGWGTAVFDYDNDGDQDIVYHGGLDGDIVGLKDNPGVLLENQGCRAEFTARTDLFDSVHQRRFVRGVAVGDLNNDGFVDVATTSDADIPAPLPLLPGPATYGSVLDATDHYVAIFSPTPNGLFTWTGAEFSPGTLTVEINSASNGNGAVTIDVLGAVGLTPRAVVNRGGIGAIVSFQPADGQRVLWPITAGSSQISQNSSSAYFGLGRAEKGDVEVLWPGGGRTRLYDVKRGERLRVPEIPCRFDLPNATAYATCVDRALADLRRASVIGDGLAARLSASAVRAYAHQRDDENQIAK